MSLGVADIQAAKDDEQLFKRLSEALNELFPPGVQEDRSQFLDALVSALRGLRAMAAIFDLDVSMSLDDLAWHFNPRSCPTVWNVKRSKSLLESSVKATISKRCGVEKTPPSLSFVAKARRIVFHPLSLFWRVRYGAPSGFLNRLEG